MLQMEENVIATYAAGVSWHRSDLMFKVIIASESNSCRQFLQPPIIGLVEFLSQVLHDGFLVLPRDSF